MGESTGMGMRRSWALGGLIARRCGLAGSHVCLGGVVSGVLR